MRWPLRLDDDAFRPQNLREFGHWKIFRPADIRGRRDRIGELGYRLERRISGGAKNLGKRNEFYTLAVDYIFSVREKVSRLSFVTLYDQT